MGLFDGTPLERPVLCDRCNKDVKLCTCPPMDVPPSAQRLSVSLEKRKKGKVVTVISGFQCAAPQLAATLSKLQSQCGTGGCVEGQSIELQGDQTKRLPDMLQALGYKANAKPSGKK